MRAQRVAGRPAADLDRAQLVPDALAQRRQQAAAILGEELRRLRRALDPGDRAQVLAQRQQRERTDRAQVFPDQAVVRPVVADREGERGLRIAPAVEGDAAQAPHRGAAAVGADDQRAGEPPAVIQGRDQAPGAALDGGKARGCHDRDPGPALRQRHQPLAQRAVLDAIAEGMGADLARVVGKACAAARILDPHAPDRLGRIGAGRPQRERIQDALGAIHQGERPAVERRLERRGRRLRLDQR